MKLTNDDYIEKIVLKHGLNISNIEDYNGAHVKILHKCNICEYKWYATPAHVGNQGTGCTKCAIIRTSKSQTKTNEQFILDLYVKNSNISALDTYRGAHTKINFKCGICNNVWNATPHSVKGCPAKECVNKNRLGYYSKTNVPNNVSVYLLHITDILHNETYYKIGLTIDITKRLYKFKEEIPGSIIKVLLLNNTSGINALNIEHNVLSIFTKFSPSTKFGGHTECFHISANIEKLRKIIYENI